MADWGDLAGYWARDAVGKSIKKGAVQVTKDMLRRGSNYLFSTGQYGNSRYYGSRLPRQRRKPIYVNYNKTYGEELKLIDKVTSHYNPNADVTSVPFVLNRVAQGTKLDERIGSVTTVKSLFIYYNVHVDPGRDPFLVNTVEHVTFRLVYDRNPNGVVPNNGSIFHMPNSRCSLMSKINSKSRWRFKILWDSGPITINYTKQEMISSVNINLNCQTQFSGTTDAATEIEAGSLYLVTMSDKVIAVGNEPRVHVMVAWRMRFVDSRSGSQYVKINSVYSKPYKFGN